MNSCLVRKCWPTEPARETRWSGTLATTGAAVPRVRCALAWLPMAHRSYVGEAFIIPMVDVDLEGLPPGSAYTTVGVSLKVELRAEEVAHQFEPRIPTPDGEATYSDQYLEWAGWMEVP